MTRFAEGTFSSTFISTIGLDFKKVEVQLSNGKSVNMQMWDTAGQEKFSTLSPMFFRGAHGVIVVYDITNEATFEHVNRSDFIEKKSTRIAEF